ncbi:Neurogenic locus notch 1 [Amphibalanus amphitrite]|uniref:Neurogenic locus notch 1 n=1 Tax=Amphibalanus amphitrite TaxID=1232801 RepID=A0A6A4VWK0_AMPAM|nr:Neurogenic locus notch 1 [Amphibalanus amphitrite]
MHTLPETELVVTDPCQPNPCGPYSTCKDINGRPTCSCLPEYLGSPPNCRPECVVSSDCASYLACVGEKCVDPCPGHCGANADCRVSSHTPVCTCRAGYTGDPFVECRLRPQTTLPPATPQNPCYEGRCGANADCREHNGLGVCSCRTNYFGNPYEGCKPECTTNSDCDRSKACEAMKCRDPCPGVCGFRAECRVVDHVAMCYCPAYLTGDPFVACNEPPRTPAPARPTQPVVVQPCSPSPCGINAQCTERGTVAVCSCLEPYGGDPYVECKPECTSNAECPQKEACARYKCIDPCPGVCGQNAECRIINHNPICHCLPGYSGDPWAGCRAVPVTPATPEDPCRPSPCGPNAECRDAGGRPICSCRPSYIGTPPNCRPECVVSSDCSSLHACIGQKCRDACLDVCGLNTICRVVNHNPVCSCKPGYSGDPFSGCILKATPAAPTAPVVVDPCSASPCGANAECREKDGLAICVCIPEYFGNPYISCQPECVLDNDCSRDKNCVRLKCLNPCPGPCGSGAHCSVVNHITMCSCPEGYTGDPFSLCRPIPVTTPPRQPVPTNPCAPSPCGANAQCKDNGLVAVCSCLAGYQGDPVSGCRPECVTHAECPSSKACVAQKCVDPCPGLCGANARCRVQNHNPLCDCLDGYSGNPYESCRLAPVTPAEPSDPCQPNPCGANSQCRNQGGSASCACLPGFLGAPPNCRPECLLSTDCASHLACVGTKCVDPCPGRCGANAQCRVVNHQAQCSCLEGYHGDPFSGCRPRPLTTARPLIEDDRDPCSPTPCGPNARCREHNGLGVCSCVPEYFGNPYEGCRPECMINDDCDRSKACERNKCVDPCPGVCGFRAECRVHNHVPMCYCPDGYNGDPFTACTPIPVTPKAPRQTCFPNPCGPNSQCRELNGRPTCSCLPGYLSSPPNCRPECTIHSDCPSHQACVGENNPCVPTPCGQNAQCTEHGGIPVCSCIKGYHGDATIGCRPECFTSSECSRHLACVNLKCIDPCSGLCGPNAQCRVSNHNPICHCTAGFTGDPYRICTIVPSTPAPIPQQQPCFPGKCGINAQCREHNGLGICTCLPEYFGNPYEGCRPECMINDDCDRSKACERNKCVDPCPGVCGFRAECRVHDHVPMCYCPDGYRGDPFTACTPVPLKPKAPRQTCFPNPCGPNSQCRELNGRPTCSCLPGYLSSPPNCRPECTIHSDCPSHQACVGEKCVDPCPGSCGQNADCRVFNHNPVCMCRGGYTGDAYALCTPIPNCDRSKACERNKCVDPCRGVCGFRAECRVQNHVAMCFCPEGYKGDPFSACTPVPVTQPPQEPAKADPCFPSPCGSNAECISKDRDDDDSAVAICKCLPGFPKGDPYTGCRPECVTNADCGQTQACGSQQKCIDPCPGLCGHNAACRVINHNPLCTCNAGYSGSPYQGCIQIKPDPPRDENPCQPSPCGPNSECRVKNGGAACSCLSGYKGAPPACRPECVMNTDCADHLACIGQKCLDPCQGQCGQNARCAVQNHRPVCRCDTGFTGDAFRYCSPIPQNCSDKNGVAVCICRDEYFGNPYSGCKPECVLDTDCPRDKNCDGNKCRNPCPGQCGTGAECHVVNRIIMCSCPEGHTGDPFSYCRLVPQTPPPFEPQYTNPCVPSPCGENAQCREANNAAVCSCVAGYHGDPTIGCRPECVSNAECAPALACINQKCKNPCAGLCGVNAQCRVLNHNPRCNCLPGYEGDPYRSCVISRNCSDKNGVAVCICRDEYFGNPYSGCKPECVLDTDCPRDKNCDNNKCRDPCPGQCGTGAECRVANHRIMCHCPEGHTGDPFSYCRLVPQTPPPFEPQYTNPCVPSPCATPRPEQPQNPCYPGKCGPNAQCRVHNDIGVCSCLPEYFGNPYEGCKPECLVDSECDRSKACERNKCVDPCPGVCGFRAECRVQNHMAICFCLEGYRGDPFTACTPIPVTRFVGDPYRRCTLEVVTQPVKDDPCSPNPCGPNSICRVIGDKAACSCEQGYKGSPPNCRPECVTNPECSADKACYGQNCLPEYFGNPYEGCKPECVVNSDCVKSKGCERNKCVDPCPGVCGFRAECRVQDHVAICYCPDGYRAREPVNPCFPSPCGPYSECRVLNGGAACSCKPTYIGAPPQCRPECVVNSECSNYLACIQEKCVDPCPGKCGLNAQCSVRSHNPRCTCLPGYTGDPYSRCVKEIEETPKQGCFPNPCGPNSQCQEVNGRPTCSCLPEYLGAPPNCRPECVVSSDCPSYQACVSQKCVDPCIGACGQNAECRVQNHNPLCFCLPGYTGNAYQLCSAIPVTPRPTAPVKVDPCFPSPCGSNANCEERNSIAVCKCIEGFFGNPYVSCRPECLLNQDCSRDKACSRDLKCVDPCPGTCGVEAVCNAVNHIASCYCPEGMIGDPFVQCRFKPAEPVRPQEPANPCVPSPCGPNANCRLMNGVALCTCLPGFIGDPLDRCRHECVSSSECVSDKACIGFKCRDPCEGTCGHRAECRVVNHQPRCSCPSGLSGDPYRACYDAPVTRPAVGDPCQPSPCGPNSVCRVQDGRAACSCRDEYQGAPPNCRPECVLNDDCSSDKACVSQKCQDICPGFCGTNAVCNMRNHIPTCSCNAGYTGDAYRYCSPIPQTTPAPAEPRNPCYPGKCGQNAQCRVHNDIGVCSCLPEYFGNPYERCRPECESNADCDRSKACERNKCVDPCPGVCGFRAECRVQAHVAMCYCPAGYEGDPFTSCRLVPPPQEPVTRPPATPCFPNPCGPNADCQEKNGVAQCVCRTGYPRGDPISGCRPECVTNEECSFSQACMRQKCRDPCPGVCGLNAQCTVQNHNPICRCNEGYRGDPFTVCRPEPDDETPRQTCFPNPCGPNSQCQEVNGRPTCSCLPEYLGAPPNCRPECVVSSDCPSYQACVSQKCVDPCIGPVVGNPCNPSPCGANAYCREKNGVAVCSCQDEYFGDPYSGCRPECVLDDDCARDKHCSNRKCRDPCPGMCGLNADCRVINHVPMCSCPVGYTGNGFSSCYPVPSTSKPAAPPLVRDPCYPNPCGTYATCRAVNGVGVCACPPDYLGDPTVGCRPECRTPSDCPFDETCVREKCIDPCPGTCGAFTQCVVRAHNPICTCLPGYIGDPFRGCYPRPG